MSGTGQGRGVGKVKGGEDRSWLISNTCIPQYLLFIRSVTDPLLGAEANTREIPQEERPLVMTVNKSTNIVMPKALAHHLQ